jgi:signal transduction histidine kinase
MVIENQLKRIRGQDVPGIYSFRANTKDGKVRWMEVNAVMLTWEGKSATLIFLNDITERKQAEEAQVKQVAALARAEELQRSRERIVIVQESLRRELAQELHGSVQNRLIVLQHQILDLEKLDITEEQVAKLKELRTKLEELLEEHCRPISHRLYPSILRQGLTPALQSLGDHFESTLDIDIEVDDELKRQERANRGLIMERVRLTAYRIAEEAINNVIKHAKASRVIMKLAFQSEGWIALTIQDNGEGFDVEQALKGLGILMMQDYAEVVGGRCNISSELGKGTKISVTLPIVATDGVNP